MTQRVDELPPCSECGGKLFPLVLCETCGAATILRDAEQLDWAAACSECGTFNPWQLICDQCHNRFPAPGHAAEPPPAPATPAPEPEVATAPKGRPTRRIKGEFDTRALLDMLKVLGLDPSRAQALIDRGYDALWKIARAEGDELRRIPEIGPVAARKMVESLHLLNYSPPQRTKESIAQDEYECPLCRCVTSAFALSCVECGAAFDEEEMDEAIRREFAEEGDAALLAFYDARLAEKPDDPDLAYARGLLMESLGRIDEAIEALDRAAAKAPDAKKIRVAALRAQAKHAGKPEVAAKLRSTASTLLDDVAWDQEVAELDQLISSGGPTCPRCGAAVPEDAVLCPSCGARLSGERPEALVPAKPAAAPSPELDTLVDDLLVGELEESLSPEELERTKAAVLDWLIEELEDSMAPDAKAAAPLGKPQEEAPAESSPLSTSVGFLSGWMRGSRGLVSGLRPKRGARGAGKVNGLVNGRGRVNGLVNGVGRVNGLVNGVGRVNGLVQPGGRVNGLVGAQGRVNGIVNGTRFVRSGARGLRLPTPSRRVRHAAIASATLVAVLIFGLLIIPIPGPSTPITIDGSFGDWAGVPMFDEATVASDANVSIARYASLLDRESLYLFASTRGGMLADSSGYDGVYFFIDADGDPATGYQFDGIGAEAVVEIFGGNFSVEGARLFSFPTNSEVNWSQRQSLGSLKAAASIQGVEALVSTYEIGRFDTARYRISVYADDFAGESSRGLAPLTAGGSVLLEVVPVTSVVGSGTSPLFNIRVRALGLPAGATWDVSSFLNTATPGVVVSLSAESVSLTQGQPEATTTASVSAPGFFPGDVIQVDVTNATATVPVVVRGGPVRAYVLAPPSTVRVDGLFADWIGRDQADSDPAPVRDPDVDILRYGAAVDTSAAYFHVAVARSLFTGRVPDRLVRPPPGQGGNGTSGQPIPLPRQTGEDILRAYIDFNSTDTVGFPIGGIYADYMFEVRGLGGGIKTQSLYAWTGTWSMVALPTVALAKNATDIEGSVAISSTTNTSRMVFEATDWSSDTDRTASIGAPSFGPSAQFGVGILSFEEPQTNGFDGSTFYLRDAGPSIAPADCSAVKGLSTTEGNFGQSLTLSGGSRHCFFTDLETSPETIHAGLWFATLDLSSSAGTALNITFAVTQADGSSPSLICYTETSTGGGANQLFGCSGGQVSIATNQRIRFRVEYVSGPSIVLGYDGSGTSEDSSIIVPAPEFGDVAAPSAVAAILILLISYRHRRRAS